MSDRAAPVRAEHGEMCARVEALSEGWRARAGATERARSLPRETIVELFDAGLLQIIVPRRYGGLELDWPTMVEAARVAARTCASTAWVMSIVGGHAGIAGRFSRDCQEVMFADGPRQLFSTASVTATGTIRKEEGGFRVHGTWRFSSGIDHATWLIVSGRCEDHPAPPVPNLFLLAVRPGQVRVEDTWHVTGMRGTGSKDVVFDNLFVPDGWGVALPDCFGARPEGAQVNPGSYLFEVPFIPYATSAIIGPILGCAEGAYHEHVAALRKRIDSSASAPSLPLGTAQERLAESAAELSCARLLYDSIVQTLHRAGGDRRPLSSEEWLALKRDRAYLARLCVNAVQRLVLHMGASSGFEGHPVQRHWRDLQSMTSHIDVNWDQAMLAYASHLLGLPRE
ncbi:acyl-CoA dehydrogenase family protein [Stigmatella aurantiaca]|uniref:Acyl-CoA dehydrogenase n=1 Tax=Stigmatella aurantiaca (strain DW4/3-1) TaxID=378806 RepID=Q08Y43_STIAD|nr:acyl-CoA dehydrogenase family protein [Stigmatella aurantiaca]ADO73037.1 Acyl-CoA dehydrogenase [Stigmatella aurantiaca DW4/3-1]EAU65396.1 acyl-CoA dehydrogenase, C-terminal domain protein [Stigmatella aurantiaca DW4/3-1]